MGSSVAFNVCERRDLRRQDIGNNTMNYIHPECQNIYAPSRILMSLLSTEINIDLPKRLFDEDNSSV